MKNQLSDFDDLDIIEYVREELGMLVYDNVADAIYRLGIGDFCSGVHGASLHRSECLKLIDELATKRGWDFVYNLVEPYKII